MPLRYIKIGHLLRQTAQVREDWSASEGQAQHERLSCL